MERHHVHAIQVPGKRHAPDPVLQSFGVGRNGRSDVGPTLGQPKRQSSMVVSTSLKGN